MNTENKNSFLYNLYKNKSLGLHLFTNIILINLVYLKFHRNRCYFKHDSAIYNKYKMMMLYTNLAFFVISGFVILQDEFIEKYDRAFTRIFKKVFTK